MKIFMTMILAMVVLSGCTEVKGAVVDNQKVWSEYVSSADISYKDNNGGSVNTDNNIIALDSLGFNVVGLDRLVADNLQSVSQYSDIYCSFMQDGGASGYPHIKEATGVEAGSIARYLTYSGNYSFSLDLTGLLAEPGNENLKFGDEIFQIDVYSDPNHKFFIETFYFVL